MRVRGPGTLDPRAIREWRLGTPWKRKCLGSCQMRKEDRNRCTAGRWSANEMGALRKGRSHEGGETVRGDSGDAARRNENI